MTKHRAPAGRGIDGLKERARASAAALGHVVSRISEQRPGEYLGRCERCLTAALVIHPNDDTPSARTGDFYGGTATRLRCSSDEGRGTEHVERCSG